MRNNDTHNKLDNFIKDSLHDVEIPYDENHWKEMEQKLNAQPQGSSFLKNFNFSLNVTIGAVIIGSGLAIYAFTGNSTASKTVTEKANETTVLSIEPTTKASIDKNVSEQKATVVAITETVPVEQQTESLINSAIEKTVANNLLIEPVSINTNQKIVIAEEKTKKKTTTSENKTEDANFIAVFDKLKKDHVVTFGDMIDPKNGFIKNTSEPTALRKEAEQKITEGNQVLEEIKNDSIRREKIIHTQITDAPSSDFGPRASSSSNEVE